MLGFVTSALWLELFLWNLQVAVLMLTKVFIGNPLCLSLLGGTVFVFPSLYACVYVRHERDTTNTLFDNIHPTTLCQFQIKHPSAEARHTKSCSLLFVLIKFFAPRAGDLTDLPMVSCTSFKHRQGSLKKQS